MRNMFVTQRRPLSFDGACALAGVFFCVGALCLPGEARAGNKKPVVLLTAPGDGAVFTAPAHIVMTANAADPDGSIKKVVFYANDNKLGTDHGGGSYRYSWKNVPPGNYVLHATATDNKNRTTPSQKITIKVVGGK